MNKIDWAVFLSEIISAAVLHLCPFLMRVFPKERAHPPLAARHREDFKKPHYLQF